MTGNEDYIFCAIGEVLERWTNRRYKSSRNLKINRDPGVDSYCVTFDLEPRLESVVAISYWVWSLTPDAQFDPRMAPIRAVDYLRQKHRNLIEWCERGNAIEELRPYHGNPIIKAWSDMFYVKYPEWYGVIVDENDGEGRQESAADPKVEPQDDNFGEYEGGNESKAEDMVNEEGKQRAGSSAKVDENLGEQSSEGQLERRNIGKRKRMGASPPGSPTLRPIKQSREVGEFDPQTKFTWEDLPHAPRTGPRRHYWGEELGRKQEYRRLRKDVEAYRTLDVEDNPWLWWCLNDDDEYWAPS